MELRKDLHIIPIEEGNIIYSPLRRGLFWADDSSAEFVRRYIKQEDLQQYADKKVVQYLNQLQEIDAVKPNYKQLSTRNLVVILSQICNMSCSYCYARYAHSKDVITIDKLRAIYDFMLSMNNGKSKRISFIGGGEPLISWPLIEWSVDYVSKHKTRNDKVFFSFATNGTLLNEHILTFCKSHEIHISVSFEILKRIQDKQRPFHKSAQSSFDIIHRNILKIQELGISFGIRSTITKENVALMPEMIEFVKSNYKSLKKVHFEQVTDTVADDSGFYDDFIKYFFEARKIGKENGIEVYNSISNSILGVKDTFCGGEFCITPTGSLVACHRISSENDKGYELFRYGQVLKHDVSIDETAYNEYVLFSKTKRTECEQCFASWHCAGICPMERMVLSQKQISCKCDFIKKIISKMLQEMISNKIEC